MMAADPEVDLRLLSDFAKAEEINSDLRSVSDSGLDPASREVVFFVLFSLSTDSFHYSSISVYDTSMRWSNLTSFCFKLSSLNDWNPLSES